MKAVILAGGYGTRLSEETGVKPKPMVEIGDKPILWHIMKIYSAAGINDFIVCLGYKGYVIKEYFASYSLHMSDITFDLRRNDVKIHQNGTEPWKVTLVETGLKTMTGGRLKRVKDYIGDETFCLTYGDGVTDVDFGALLAFHRERGKVATVTAVRPNARFGRLAIEQGLVRSFAEKPGDDAGWINGGFFVFEPSVFDYLSTESNCVLERRQLEQLAADGELAAFQHDGFWQCMDTYRDLSLLDDLWRRDRAPWKNWANEE